MSYWYQTATPAPDVFESDTSSAKRIPRTGYIVFISLSGSHNLTPDVYCEGYFFYGKSSVAFTLASQGVLFLFSGWSRWPEIEKETRQHFVLAGLASLCWGLG